MSRITAQDLEKLVTKPGYGIQSAFGGPALRERALGSAFSSPRQSSDVESGAGLAQIQEEGVQVGYSGICVVRIKFYRRRLADYSRANCEKYLIDSAVYAGLIRDDSEKEIRLIDEGQIKVETEAEERVEITFEYPEVDYDNLWVKKTKFGNATK